MIASLHLIPPSLLGWGGGGVGTDTEHTHLRYVKETGKEHR